MNIKLIQPKKERGFFYAALQVVSDPYYHIMNLPSLWWVLAVAILVLAVVSSIMVGVWTLVKLVATGTSHSPSSVPIKMFIAMATTVIFTIFSGIILRYLTKADIRGKFIYFSKYLVGSGVGADWDERFVFEVIDKRTTQLIGMSITAQVTINNGRGDYEFRRIPIQSPGIIALPTEVEIPIRKIFPESLTADCNVCGKPCTVKTLASHMEYYHGMDKAGAVEARRVQMQTLVDSIEEIKIRISGVDEVSGKGGSAEYTYERNESIIYGERSISGGKSSINSGGIRVSLDDNFSVTTTIDGLGPHPWSPRAEQTSSPSSTCSKKYIHVDFKYQ
jgi:hypothetical protein